MRKKNIYIINSFTKKSGQSGQKLFLIQFYTFKIKSGAINGFAKKTFPFMRRDRIYVAQGEQQTVV